jgi:hypothetical protein
MNTVGSPRSRSGDAWYSYSSIRRARSILALTVIVGTHSRALWKVHSKHSPVAVAYVSVTRSSGSIHHSAGRNNIYFCGPH